MLYFVIIFIAKQEKSRNHSAAEKLIMNDKYSCDSSKHFNLTLKTYVVSFIFKNPIFTLQIDGYRWPADYNIRTTDDKTKWALDWMLKRWENSNTWDSINLAVQSTQCQANVWHFCNRIHNAGCSWHLGDADTPNKSRRYGRITSAFLTFPLFPLRQVTAVVVPATSTTGAEVIKEKKIWEIKRFSLPHPTVFTDSFEDKKHWLMVKQTEWVVYERPVIRIKKKMKRFWFFNLDYILILNQVKKILWQHLVLFLLEQRFLT